MRTPVETTTTPYGYTINIYYDEYTENPQQEYDNVGTLMLHDRCRYSFGNEKGTREDIKAIEQDENLISLPVYMYDHSGITIRTTPFSCPWDSGQVGVIYCTKEWGNKVWGNKGKEAAMRCMEGEIRTLNDYLTGEVYGWEIIDDHGDEVDSCWGYIGEIDYCMQEARSAADYHYAQQPQQAKQTPIKTQ